MRDSYRAKRGDEWTLAHSGAIPRHDPEKNNDGADIDDSESEKGHPDSARNIFRRARFAGRDRNHLDPTKAINRVSEGDYGRPKPGREESPLSIVLRHGASAREQRSSDQDEGDDRRQLNHREPELYSPIGTDTPKVDHKQERAEDDDPHIRWHAREPNRHVSCGGNHFRSNREGETDPIT